MEQVRYVVIGAGNMGTSEVDWIGTGHIKNAVLAGVCDCDPVKLTRVKEKYGDSIKYFKSTQELFEAEDVYDAILVATPHYDHPTIAIEGFKKGLHVLVEKPAGVYTKKVREMNEVAAASDQVFGIMYNQRTNPLYKKVKSLIQEGELGEIRRINWLITSWYRPQSYYDSGTWRATWSGEGGGVLINQCPHQLDLWQWMSGMMPRRIRAFAAYGKMHDIEVEDDVTAYAEYENGATAVFITTTGEAPGTNRLEIAGDNGKVVVENGKLEFYRNRISEREFNKAYKGGFGSPECWKIDIPVHGVETGHTGIIQNFTNAILRGEKLIAPGEEGIKGLSISNAIHLSSWLDDWVELPIDEELYYEKLQEKIKESTIQKAQIKSEILSVKGTF